MWAVPATVFTGELSAGPAMSMRARCGNTLTGLSVTAWLLARRHVCTFSQERSIAVLGDGREMQPGPQGHFERTQQFGNYPKLQQAMWEGPSMMERAQLSPTQRNATRRTLHLRFLQAVVLTRGKCERAAEATGAGRKSCPAHAVMPAHVSTSESPSAQSP